LLTEQDVRLAFAEAAAGKPVILALTNHDFRDMAPDIDSTRELIHRVAQDYPSTPFLFSEAISAMRSALDITPQTQCELDMKLQRVSDSTHVLKVESNVPSFGPQPWLALKTVDGTYHFDNFDIDTPFHSWQYVFDEETFPLRALDAIGVAANNAFGVTTVAVMDPATGSVRRKNWNLSQSVLSEAI
jgi:hypothetical protein